MTQFNKPHMAIGSLGIQDDHYWRMADICFRHLAGAHENYKNKLPHLWIKQIDNENSKFGRSEYMASLRKLGFHESEEYTQSLATIVFCHVWVLSTANYYRISVKEGSLKKDEMGGRLEIKNADSLGKTAENLGLPEEITSPAYQLSNARYTIMHLITDRKNSYPIDEIDFKVAYHYVCTAWKIYIALLEHYGRTPDENSWVIQTNRYGLPITSP